MAHINHLAFLRHLRAEPNQYILHYRRGNLVREGAGLAYWFHPLSAAAVQVPVEDIETTFVLRERSSDSQEITVQVTLIYRVADAEILGVGTPTPYPYASYQQVEEAADPPQHIVGIPARRSPDPPDRRETPLRRHGDPNGSRIHQAALDADAAIGRRHVA